ncbi:MAG: diguanylate cyclase domain-containing protein [Thermodesulfobacteriota bacterium]
MPNKIFYFIQDPAVLEIFFRASENRQITTRKTETFSFLNNTKSLFAVVEEHLLDEDFEEFINSPSKENQVFIILIIQKEENRCNPLNKNLLLDYITYSDLEKKLPARIDFGLKTLNILHKKSESQNRRNNDLLKINREKEQTLLEITDKITKELNQPLTTLLCNAEFLKSETKDNPSAAKKAERIIDSGSRITESIKKIQSLKLSSDIYEEKNRYCSNETFNILIITPEKTVSKKLKKVLKNIGHTEADCVESFQAGLKKLSEKCFDLILTEEKIKTYTYDYIFANLRSKAYPETIILTSRPEKTKNTGIYIDNRPGYLLKSGIKRSSVEKIIKETKEKVKLKQELKQTKNRLHELPMRDGLTGLYNKRWFFEILPKEMSRSRRYKSGLTICIGEIKDFHGIKEQLGYLSGEKLVSIISSILLSYSRNSDFCCRYDNSFAVVLPDTPAKGGELFAQRINNILNKHKFLSENSETCVNIKWGICQFNPVNHPTAGEMVESVFESIQA